MRSLLLKSIDKRTLLRLALDFPDPFFKKIEHWSGIAAIVAVAGTLAVILLPTFIRMVWG